MKQRDLVLSESDINNYMFLLESKIKDLKIDYHRIPDQHKKEYIDTWKPYQQQHFNKWMDLNKRLRENNLSYYLPQKEREIKSYMF